MLSRVYTGPLEGIAPVRVPVPTDCETLCASDLLDPQTLTSLLNRFGGSYPGGDRRAVASLWSKWHLSNVLAHGLAANLLLERELPLALEETRIELSPEGYTVGLCLQNEGILLTSGNAQQRFERIIDRHLEPLIRALSDWSGAAPRVFWSNAGNYFEYFAQALQTHPLALAHTNAPALEILETRVLANGKRNPLYKPVRYQPMANGAQRVRQLCCLRYLLPTVQYCENCPLTCLKSNKKPASH
ncbi:MULTISPECIES: siderophore-iron reductase FhuF [Pseudomonas]|uniref:siderophore-iron reductase FhuF n=1 Tax=Pseudomonas TaxID=286 RepID=UPI0013A78CBA|nr:siderophore-iron reductase FhuF [Pseudomonas sp. OIL-1]QIB51538.1 siderophore-iron reductase FhuF [Pseudomonas sp. OIL-1]